MNTIVKSIFGLLAIIAFLPTIFAFPIIIITIVIGLIQKNEFIAGLAPKFLLVDLRTYNST